MIAYPVIIEPHQESRKDGTVDDMFIARFPDVPELTDCIGFERDDAISNAIERLNWALTDIYLAGKPMPCPSAVKSGELGIATPLFWLVA